MDNVSEFILQFELLFLPLRLWLVDCNKNSYISSQTGKTYIAQIIVQIWDICSWQTIVRSENGTRFISWGESFAAMLLCYYNLQMIVLSLFKVLQQNSCYYVLFIYKIYEIYMAAHINSGQLTPALRI